MTEALRSVLLGTAGPSVACAVALALTLARGAISADDARLRSTVRLAGVAVLLQAAHFAEELATGFHLRFPPLLGLAAWSVRFFVIFNVFWLAVWALAVYALAARRRAGLFPLWFLGLGGIMNGIAHPLLSLLGGGYFPGLVTSPFVGVAGVLLLRRLAEITSGAEPSLGAA